MKFMHYFFLGFYILNFLDLIVTVKFFNYELNPLVIFGGVANFIIVKIYSILTMLLAHLWYNDSMRK